MDMLICYFYIYKVNNQLKFIHFGLNQLITLTYFNGEVLRYFVTNIIVSSFTDAQSMVEIRSNVSRSLMVLCTTLLRGKFCKWVGFT